jgi:hypothetical protein
VSSRKPRCPRRLFRCRRRSDVLHVGDREPLPAVEAWIAQNRARLKPGTVGMVEVWHDHDCRYPQGEIFTCKHVPEVRLASDQPEEN